MQRNGQKINRYTIILEIKALMILLDREIKFNWDNSSWIAKDLGKIPSGVVVNTHTHINMPPWPLNPLYYLFTKLIYTF